MQQLVSDMHLKIMCGNPGDFTLPSHTSPHLHALYHLISVQPRLSLLFKVSLV